MKTYKFVILFILITNNLIWASVNNDTDWIVEIANTTIKNNPDPSQLGWYWGDGILMYGIWKAYWYTGQAKYFNYIKNYVDTYVDENGEITVHYNNDAWVNRVTPAILLPKLYETTHDQRYLNAALIVADYLFNTCPRVDNAIVHINDDQLWIDTVYMICIFLAQMGKLTQEDIYFDFSVNQLLYHAEKLQDPVTKLFYHGWDQDGSAVWADAINHTSPCFWARGNGWAAMTFVEILDVLPDSHAKKGILISMFQEFIDNIITYQDSNTGLWFTVIDKSDSLENYTETSASAMFTYSIEKGIQNGYLSSAYQASADLGDQGVRSKLYITPQGYTNVYEISEGTIVGDYDYYVSRPTRKNLNYGVGAALVEKTLFRTLSPPQKVSNIQISHENDKLIFNWDPVKFDIENKPILTDEYILYKSSSVNFTSGETDSLSLAMNTHYEDSLITGHIENPQSNIFYCLKAKYTHGILSASSDIYGEYDFQLTNASTQGYYQYVPDLDFSNFTIERGAPLHVNAENNGIVTLVGKVADRNYQLSTTQTTNFNEIMLPLDKTEINNAAALMAAIPNCDNVARWNNVMQGYEQYIPGLSYTNFEVKPGYPYHISVTAETVWPDNIIPKTINNTALKTIQNSGSKAPHTVYGKLPYPETDIVHFSAFLDTHPAEKLEETSPGCSLHNEHWIIQCASFPSKWKAGDILNINFY
ncbi:MAG: glycoside hydrolase family 88 protein, partial [bacterium]